MRLRNARWTGGWGVWATTRSAMQYVARKTILPMLGIVQETAAAHDTVFLMQYRELGRTGWKVSDISFGAWAIGGAWGNVSDDESLVALQQAIDCGVNFINTADVYGDGGR